MAPNDTRLLRIGDLATALMLLTRIPLPGPVPDRGARSAWAWPLAGLCVGGVAAAAGWLCLGLPATIAAGIVLAVTVLATGCLHEDGLADVADGFWGGNDPARRLEIMRDSRIGSYGVIALILSLGLRWAALTVLVGHGALAGIVAAAVLSRAPMAVVMRALPNARRDGLSRSVGLLALSVWTGLGLAAALGVLLAGGAGLLALAALAPVVLAAAWIARVKIGGQTGDVLGAVQQLGELTVLVTIAALQ